MASKFSYFPSIYHGESLYSLIARYHSCSIGNSHKDTIEEIFGTRDISVSPEFPTHLEEISRRLDMDEMTKESILYEHTLYSIYEPFLFEKEQRDIKNKMYQNGGLGIKGEIGFLAGSILKSDYMYFCPECVNEDVDKYGESYFRVIWQMQGYLVCHMHNIMMEPYPEKQSDVGRVSYITLEHDKICDIQLKMNTDPECLYISKMINDVYEGMLKDFDAQTLKILYHRKLGDLDYLTANGEASYHRLLPVFMKYYDKLLEKFDSVIDPRFEHSWFRKIIRKKCVKVHPIRHLLYIRFLFGSVKNLRNYADEDEVDNCYPCLNKVCPGYKKFVITKVNITADYKTREAIGTFKCSFCGYVYSRKMKANIYKKGRVKDFGPLFMDELMEISKRQDMSLREKAKYLGCDPKTVIKYSEAIK